MRICPIFLVLVLLLTACSQTSQPLDSGIEGSVTIGPMCPVMQLNEPCPDQSYQAVLAVLTPNGKKVTQFQTDENGHFRMGLAPGDYVLHPVSPNMLPYASDVPFRVEEGMFIKLEISYDSGIR